LYKEKIGSLLLNQKIIGLRTIKTVVAVLATSLFMTYVLGHNPFFACIGAVVAMERTLSTSIRAAVIRNIATVTGGLIGIIIGSFTENVVLMALGLIPLIWINNGLGKKESIVPGSIVYFAVFYLNTMEQAWAYGLTRILGTLIGSLIALAINALVFPPKSFEQQEL
jgi:uncharacterized membrane protein YgaE (UPF0421/DUF939 family)